MPIEAAGGPARPLDVAALIIEAEAREGSGDMEVHLGEVEAGEVVFVAGNVFPGLLR